MNFVDNVALDICAGKGGDGLVHLKHEKFKPKGGPDGGDGGRGGSVYLEVTTRRQTLGHLAGLSHIKADAGKNGGVDLKTGHSGDDVILEVPVGTIVQAKETGNTIFDLTKDGERVCIAQGGKGGRGNWHFRSSTNQAPKEAEPGEPGQELTVQLTLKLIADIGLVGQPNAGKSTLINIVTNAQSKVGAYPFTTLDPHLGVLRTDEKELVIADIPGLIEGAAEGKGLGHEFLRHIERTKVLTLIVPADSADPIKEYQQLRKEVGAYSPELGGKPFIVVVSKSELNPHVTTIAKALKKQSAVPVFIISAHTHAGLDELVMGWQKLLDTGTPTV